MSAEARAAPAATVAADAALRILELELELARRPATDASAPVPAKAHVAPAATVAAEAALRILQLELELARLKRANLA